MSGRVALLTRVAVLCRTSVDVVRHATADATSHPIGGLTLILAPTCHPRSTSSAKEKEKAAVRRLGAVLLLYVYVYRLDTCWRRLFQQDGSKPAGENKAWVQYGKCT